MTMEQAQPRFVAVESPEKGPPDADSEGMKLIRHLESNQFHPVLIFGTQSTGKTVMLLSLINFAINKAGNMINVAFGERDPVFPPDFRGFPPDPMDAVALHENARELFNNMVNEFGKGRLPGTTQVRAPFFVPITLTVDVRRRGQEDFNLAFLESMGEWYTMELKSRYKEFQPVLAEVLKRLNSPLSAIFVAPIEAEAAQSLSIEDSYRCLVNCMNEYRGLRLNGGRHDNLLLLITKWDAAYQPAAANFAEAKSETVLRAVTANGNDVWQSFRGPAFEAARSFTPYTAAWIDDDKRIISPGDYEVVFDRFNKTIWNWLYGNVTEKRHGRRRILYPEVMPSPMSWYAKAAAGLLLLRH